MTDALLHAELLAAAIVDGIAGTGPLIARSPTMGTAATRRRDRCSA